MRASLPIELTRIELSVEDVDLPADFVPVDYQGPVLVAVAHANRITSLTPRGHVVRPLALDAAARLAEQAAAARTVEARTPFDTADRRTLTRLSLRIDGPRGGDDSFTLEGAVSDREPHTWPLPWSELLVSLRDAIGELGEAEADCWDRALAWLAPIDLGRRWHAGSAVRLPHLVTCIQPGRGLYLRTGQPPRDDEAVTPYRANRSVLYHLAPATLERSTVTLTCVDDRSVVPPDHTRLRWRLPCGTGLLTYYHEYHERPRVVIRVDDPTRGIYVERDPRA